MEGFLLDVLKPGRYINREWNSVHKDWKNGVLKFALCFPDIYEIGMSHLGMRIIYGILNYQEDVVCERVFAPWADMERKIRGHKIPFFSLESKRALNEFDIIGFSLQYELNFVDVLNILDLGGVPLRSSERGDADPIVIAGGPCVFNPEPISEFIDAFVIGEAEEAVLEIVRIARSLLIDTRCSRQKVLQEFSKTKGVYVPSIQHPASSIQKRIIKDLDSSYFPTNPIVPYIQIVHDRINLEIMRGCLHHCRFCQACTIFHPLRIRSVKRLLEIAEESIKNTGYEEISLLSLSSGDYPYLEELVRKLGERFRPQGIKISLPSLRVKELDNAGIGSIVKRSGLTFAPEAGSNRLRKCIDKDMDNEEIIEKSKTALSSGWKKVKLYFMIGLPGETHEDLDEIIDLASQIKSVSLSISPFIPKPHSGFEREGMDSLEVLKDKIECLKSRRRSQNPKGYMKMDFHRPEMSRVEAILSRGDRRIGDVVCKAWQKGARLQAWTDYFDYNLWLGCFEESGVNPDDYLKTVRSTESLAWDFIEA